VAATPTPCIAIVTPAYNQAPYLEQAIRSVAEQAYPELEYVIVDGGSTDGSVDIIRRHAHRLAYWCSEPDGGHMDAINKGFAHTHGEIMAWLNSDDMLCPWALHTVGRIFRDLPQVQWLTTSTPLRWNAAGEGTAAFHLPGFSRTWFYRGWHLGDQPGFVGYIQQESTFWRRALWERAGGRVDAALHYAGDFDLWARFFEHADLVSTRVPLGGFRQHDAQKTAQMERYYAEARQVLGRHRGRYARSPLVRALLALGHRLTGRGGQRFGSRLAWVEFDLPNDRWQYQHRYCF
jgi:glycosyltransferase involved in cell wall biosynthesis